MTGASAASSIIHNRKVRADNVYDHKKPTDMEFSEPDDITEVSHRQLGQFMGYFTNLHCFALQGLAVSDLEAQAAKLHLDFLKKQYFLLHDDDKQPKYKLEAQAMDDKNIVSAENKSFETKAYYKLMGAQVSALENKVALFSREISRRSADQSHTGRAN